jgi:hypothetical protein
MPISVVRGLGAGCLLGLTLLTALPAQSVEKDELASAQHMLIQVQAALERARVQALTSIQWLCRWHISSYHHLVYPVKLYWGTYWQMNVDW